MNVLVRMRDSQAFRFVPGSNCPKEAYALANVSCTRSSASAVLRVMRSAAGYSRFRYGSASRSNRAARCPGVSAAGAVPARLVFMLSPMRTVGPAAGSWSARVPCVAVIITTPSGWPAGDVGLPQGEPARDVLAGQWRGLQSEGSGSPAPGLGLTRASIGLTRAGGCGTAPDCEVRPLPVSRPRARIRRMRAGSSFSTTARTSAPATGNGHADRRTRITAGHLEALRDSVEHTSCFPRSAELLAVVNNQDPVDLPDAFLVGGRLGGNLVNSAIPLSRPARRPATRSLWAVFPRREGQGGRHLELTPRRTRATPSAGTEGRSIGSPPHPQHARLIRSRRPLIREPPALPKGSPALPSATELTRRNRESLYMPRRLTMWLAMQHPGISALRADALFVSALQRSDDPSTDQVRNAIAAAVHEFGGQGCAGQVAQEFGDHPETAMVRMRWARALASEACRSWSARWSCVGTAARTGTPRSGSSPATRRHAEPNPPPAVPVTSTKPLLARALLYVHRGHPKALQPAKLTLVKKKSSVAFMKRYGQACAIARALDVVGERWNLLLVRELTFGPRRYRDLATGLPGIPSNVLAARLKDLQAAGVITRRTLPAPTDVTVYELTGAGRALQPALSELLHWGLRYGPEPSPDDASQPGRPASCGSDRRSSTSAPTPERSPSAAGRHRMATRWSPCLPTSCSASW